MKALLQHIFLPPALMNCLKALWGDCCKACDLKLRLRKTRLLDCKSRLKGQFRAARAADCSSISKSKGYCCGPGDFPQAYTLTKKKLNRSSFRDKCKKFNLELLTPVLQRLLQIAYYLKNCSSPQHHFSLSQLTISTSAQFSRQCILLCSGLYSIPIVVISQHLPAVWQPTSLMCICHMLIFLFFSLLLPGRNLHKWK